MIGRSFWPTYKSHLLKKHFHFRDLSLSLSLFASGSESQHKDGKSESNARVPRNKIEINPERFPTWKLFPRK